MMWEEIIIDNKIFIISKSFKEDEWKIILTNLKELWIENLSSKDIVKKCERLNPLLDFEQLNLHKIIGDMLDSISENAVSVTINQIKLQTIIEGGLFNFAINFTKASDEEFFKEIIIPLCASLYELQRQNNILIEEMKRKDEEITEYKLNGAELIRKHIVTKPFNENLLKSKDIEYDENFISLFKSIINKNGSLIRKTKFIECENRNTDEANVINPRQCTSVSEITKIRGEDSNNAQINKVIKNHEKPSTSNIEIYESNKNIANPIDKPLNTNVLKDSTVPEITENSGSKNKKRPRRELSDFIS